MQGHSIKGLILSQVYSVPWEPSVPGSGPVDLFSEFPRSRGKSLTNSHEEFRCTYPTSHSMFHLSSVDTLLGLGSSESTAGLAKMHALCSIRRIVNYTRTMCNFPRGYKSLQCHGKLKIIAAHNEQLKLLSIQNFIMTWRKFLPFMYILDMYILQFLKSVS